MSYIEQFQLTAVFCQEIYTALKQVAKTKNQMLLAIIQNTWNFVDFW
jgi:hypothetical protein